MSKLSSTKDKLKVLYDVLQYRPLLVGFLVVFSVLTGLMEGIGLGFIYPIVEIVESGVEGISGEEQIIQFFISFYSYFDIPFTLENLLIGVSFVVILRYSASFGLGWLKASISKRYETHLKKKTFQSSLDAGAVFLDDKGPDKILNHTLTETRYSSKSIVKSVEILEILSLILIYLSVMLYVSPVLTFIAIVLLGGIMSFLRLVVDPAISIGSDIAESNEEIQEQVQAGIYGIRDVKLFNLGKEIFRDFEESLEKYRRSEVKLNRNEAGMKNFYKMSAALSLFSLIYLGITYTDLVLGELGIFFVAMFQLAPKLSSLNSKIYLLEGYLSHFVRTQKYIENVEKSREDFGERDVDEIEEISFEDVSLSYGDEEALKNARFKVEKGEFIAFTGKSGAGKSTVASLIPRLYKPDSGSITSSGTDINEFRLNEWRSRIAVVRQEAFLFNASLIENVKIGNPNAGMKDVEQVCKIAQIDEFIDELPEGYDSKIGENGVKLSGGQRQRIAIARALLKDVDLLILDEATSNLDSQLETQVYSSIQEKRRSCGIIAIAHRLSTIKNADKIYTLKNGEIVEKGTHKELMQKEGSYYNLYKEQIKGGSIVDHHEQDGIQ